MTAADIFLEQGRGGGVLGYKGGSGKATGQHDGRKEQSDGMKSLFDGKEKVVGEPERVAATNFRPNIYQNSLYDVLVQISKKPLGAFWGS